MLSNSVQAMIDTSNLFSTTPIAFYFSFSLLPLYLSKEYIIRFLKFTYDSKACHTLKGTNINTLFLFIRWLSNTLLITCSCALAEVLDTLFLSCITKSIKLILLICIGRLIIVVISLILPRFWLDLIFILCLSIWLLCSIWIWSWISSHYRIWVACIDIYH